MYILGVDVSKHELVAVVINKRAQVRESFVISNDKDSIESWLDRLETKYKKLLIGSEATGEYHNLLALCCLRRSLGFKVINPIVTKQFTRATVRKKKTDLSDAEVIAKCLLQGEGEKVSEAQFFSLKPILRTVSQLSRVKVSVSHMNLRFSEFFELEKEVIKELTSLKQAIELSRKRIESLALKRVDNELSSLLQSIPGIGPNLSAILISELADISRFRDSKALVAYSGLDPKVRQSGATLKRNTKLTKRGSPYLRRALYIAASIAQRYDPVLKKYFEKKKGEGKRYKEATIANARHILFRVYAVWKRGTPYVKA